MDFVLDDAAGSSGSRHICSNDFNVLSSILKASDERLEGVCAASSSDVHLVIAVVR